MSDFSKYGIAGIVAFIMFSSLWSAFSSDPAMDTVASQIAQQNEQVRATRVAAAKEGVPLLIQTGLIFKIEPPMYRASVNEEFWNQYSIDQKTTAATALGYYIQDKNGDKLGIDIYGAHSGQKLGEWNDRSGFKAN